MIIADCTFALPSIWSWDSIYIYCWVQIANIFLRVFVSVFMRCVGLQSSCAVSVWFCFQDDAGYIEVGKCLSSSEVFWKMFRIVIS